MVVSAQILGLKHITGTSVKTNKPYSFHVLSVLDQQSPEPEIIKINVNDDQVPAVSSLVGKTGNININFSRGNFSLLVAGK